MVKARVMKSQHGPNDATLGSHGERQLALSGVASGTRVAATSRQCRRALAVIRYSLRDQDADAPTGEQQQESGACAPRGGPVRAPAIEQVREG